MRTLRFLAIAGLLASSISLGWAQDDINVRPGVKPGAFENPQTKALPPAPPAAEEARSDKNGTVVAYGFSIGAVLLCATIVCYPSRKQL